MNRKLVEIFPKNYQRLVVFRKIYTKRNGFKPSIPALVNQAVMEYLLREFSKPGGKV